MSQWPLLRGCLAYVLSGFAYMDALCKVGLWEKMCLRNEVSYERRGNKRFGNLL